MTTGELVADAGRVAALIRRSIPPGERCLLVYPPGLDYIRALFGCMWAQVVAVPAQAPEPRLAHRQTARMAAVAADCQAAAVLTTAALLPLVRGGFVVDDLPSLRWLATDAADDTAGGAGPETLDESVELAATALLQYTSGSTRRPRGVLVTHANLAHNAANIRKALKLTENSRMALWLPPHHDMGLIGGILQAAFVGYPVILMSPVDFLRRPVSWLETMTRHRATHAGAPNFGYDLCARRIVDADRAGLDLSSWQVAFSGAEPVRAATLDRFTAAFESYGFRRQAFCPVYGLAEATLLVSAKPHGTEPVVGRFDAEALARHSAVELADEPQKIGARSEEERVGVRQGVPVAPSRQIVSCGRPVEEIAIVDPSAGTPVADGQVGEIWLRGPSVSTGYFSDADLTARTFGARLAGCPDTFLRTGDLGFLHSGELYVTGRHDDVVIISGRNHYPQDIEFTVEGSHPALRPGCGAAFMATVDGDDRLVIVQEVDPAREVDAEGALRAIRSAVGRGHGVHVHAVVLVRPRTVPKTASGKVQRSACRELFLRGELDVVARSVRRPTELSGLGTAFASGPAPATVIQATLVDLLARRAGVQPAEVDVTEPMSQLGIDSIVSVEIAEEVRAWLHVDLAPSLVYGESSIAALAELLAQRTRPATAASDGTGGPGGVAGADDADRTPERMSGRASLTARRSVAPTAPAASSDREAIAVIGLGCRFPGAPDPDAFWRLLRDGGDAIREVPPTRWDVDAYFDPEIGAPGRMYTRRGGFLDDIDTFDAAFFGISPREAVEMDPQQRLLLEVAWEALENAGQVPADLAGTRTGVFIGLSNEEYSGLRRPGDSAAIDAYTGTGIAASVAAGRLSYTLGLTGPCMTVDTACSSSLVSTHLACASLRAGESDLALAGGVNLILSPRGTIYFCQVRVMSPAGACRTFDADADGYVRSEGCGMIVLKRLADALRDEDPVVAVIRGTAVNHDGRSGGLTVPSGRAQQAVIRQALTDAGVSADEVGLIEAHGTATALGDPIEARALAEVFHRSGGRPLALGSVKTNMGHAESAAGIAGVIKVALALRHGGIPPNLHYETPNPHVPLARMNAFVPTRLAAWPEGRRIAGVSSFGLSGTNAHVVLEAAPARSRPTVDPGPAPFLLPLSARGSAALRALAARHLDLAVATDDTAVTAARAAAVTRRRQHHDDRLAVAFENTTDLRDVLEAYLRGESRPGLSTGKRSEGRDARVVFVFGGQGSQWPGMARELLEDDPVFRSAIERTDAAIRREAGWSLTRMLTDADPAALDQIDVVQPALFAIQVALADVWQAWGVRPSAVVGQSMGEIAAAHVAGALDLDDAVRVICRRARLMRRVSGAGAMAAVDLSYEAARQALAAWSDRLSVAVSSSPRASVVAGDGDAIDEFCALMEQRQVFCRRIKVDVASHSSQVEPLRADVLRELAAVTPRRPTVPFYSTLLGRRVDEAVFDADYWMRNLREPVLLATAVERLLDDGRSVFLELGPHPVVLPAIEQTISCAGRPGTVVASLRRGTPEAPALRAALGALYSAGAGLDWRAVYPQAPAVALPTYPWQRERFWLDTGGNPVDPAASARPPDTAARPAAGGPGADGTAPAARALGGGGDSPLLGAHIRLAAPPGIHVWEGTLSVTTHPYLADHRVNGAIILPAAGYVEMVLAGAAVAVGDGPLELTDVVFDRALVLPPDGVRAVQLVLTPRLAGSAAFEILSREAGGTGDGDGDPRLAPAEWVSHARGGVRLLDPDGPASAPTPLDEPPGDDHQVLTGEGHYAALAARALSYGPLFQGVAQVWRNADGARCRIDPPADVARAAATYRLHPVLLDAGFQLLAALPADHAAGAPADAYVPVGIRSMRVRQRGATARWAIARRDDALPPGPADAAAVAGLAAAAGPRGSAGSADADSVEGSVTLLGEHGDVIAEVRGLRARRLETGSSRRPDPRDYMFRVEWRHAPGDGATEAAGRAGTWLIFADSGGVADSVRAALTARGHRCVLVRPTAWAESGDDLDSDVRLLDPSSPEACRRLLADICPDGPPAGVVHLAAAATEPLPTSGDALAVGQRWLLGGALHLVQEVSRVGWRNPPRVWFVTAGAQAVGPTSAVAVTQAPLWGLARVAAHELPELRTTCVDLSPRPVGGGGADPAEVAALCALLLGDGAEDQIALRGGDRFVARLARHADDGVAGDGDAVAGDAGSDPRRSTGFGAVDGESAFRLEADRPGVLDQLHLHAVTRRPPQAGEVEIEVHASGLNFSDVMKAMGVYPGLAGAPPVIGGECAGTVVRAGDGVTAFAPGDRVAAIAPWSLASHVTVPAELAVRLPADVDFTAAATVPVAFVTACYALERLAHLTAGERVLVHSASGGVGLAAIQVARAAGAEVLATAGTPEKRAYLESLGIRTVMDSRSLAFADEVLAATGGDGVDVVLNSLAGAALARGLDVLRPFGRFIELGKRDIYLDGSLGLGAFRRNLTFAAVDLEEVLRTRPRLVASVLADIGARLRAGTLRPLPAEARPISEAQDAFRHMAAARHIGKMVVLPREGDVHVRPAPDDGPSFPPDATYLITGGLGALGLRVAAWMAGRGARHLVLLGRRGEVGASDQVRGVLAELRRQGVVVLGPAVDVADRAALDGVLARIDADPPPLRGVIHAAGLLDDGVLLQLDAARFERVAAPKVRGAWNLHEATLSRTLDFFVLFSSGASLLGSPGQGNYAAANAFLDALAEHRAAVGLPAMAVGWGPWSEIGLAARPDRGGRLALGGLDSLTPAQGLAALGRLMRRPPTHIGVFPVDADAWRRASPALAGMPVLTELMRDAGRTVPRQRNEVRDRLLAGDPGPGRWAVLEEHVRSQIAQVLRIPPARLDNQTPLDTLGFDSLMALELRNRLEASLDVPISATMAWNYPTIARIVPHLAERMEIPLDAPPEPGEEVDAELAAILGGIDALTDAELDALQKGGTSGATDAPGE
ncbi:phthiocerol/phenolphthiocerol synthesis type-I polyketide synthase C [Frankia sp. Hr75.2]|nr:phthiocerol/phenolphthiocerol synthesis type-I polyketide synthase C [Frankia sp. Hr75.2]